MLTLCLHAGVVVAHRYFFNLQTSDGLSNSKVSDIFKDSNGYMWFATESGLDRFDGFRFKNFFYDNHDDTSLPNNSVTDIQQGIYGNLWIKTSVGYCVYLYKSQSFDRNPINWMQQRGMRGTPEIVFVDHDTNMWFNIFGKGCYFFDGKKGKPWLFRMSNKGKNTIPVGKVSSISENGDDVFVTYDNGIVACLNGKAHKVKWINKYVSRVTKNKTGEYNTFKDKQGNYWIYSQTLTFVYNSKTKKWYNDIVSFLASYGIKTDCSKLLVKKLQLDPNGNICLCSDHNGLLVIDLKKKMVWNFRYDPMEEGSIAGNTILDTYFDNEGGVWIGTYNNGVSYYSDKSSKFSTILLGDICTIAEDKNGNLWCGTNDKGIVEYNPYTKQQKLYGKAKTGLGSDVVVSSLAARDGTLYFGTYNGGFACYKNGIWKVIRASNKRGGLDSDNVWSLAEDEMGNIILGTLGAGMQVMNPKTFYFESFNTTNSALASDYINSLYAGEDGNVYVGHSVDYSIFNIHTRTFTNYNKTEAGEKFPDPSINQIYNDSRGLVWAVTPSGASMYDPQTQQLISSRVGRGVLVRNGCSVIENKKHQMILVYDHSVLILTMYRKEDGQWGYIYTTYNHLDGLQKRQFNQRAICRMRNGDVVIGGQDGINIIPATIGKDKKTTAKALFSRLYIFDEEVQVGKEFNGRIILKNDMDNEIELKSSENFFTVLLASSQPELPSRCQFLWRLKGRNDKWMETLKDRADITFADIAPGKYVLQVRVVNSDGSVSPHISELKITINPPFYLSTWAKDLYVVILLLSIFLLRKRSVSLQKRKMEALKMQEARTREKELESMKSNFFTSISHDLRTPLMLIAMPITKLLKKETDDEKRKLLKLISNNANFIMRLVNQIVDFNKININNNKLIASMGDIVALVKTICNSFATIAGGSKIISFNSPINSLTILFDPEKMTSIINNLLNNACKFTPEENGSIDVSLSLRLAKDFVGVTSDMLVISVADNGIGIENTEKEKIFNKYYQADPNKVQPFGGSGIGLYLVKSFAELHGGNVTIKDNPGGGTIFEVMFPIRFDVSKSQQKYQDIVSTIKATGDSGANLYSLNKETFNSGEDGKLLLQQKADYALPTIESSEVEQDVDKFIYESIGKEPNKKPIILLVDDSADFREFVVGEIVLYCRVIEASNGDMALKKLETVTPDVIISDVMMPIMDGLEFCKRVKANPKTADIPFVMVTARVFEENKKDGIDAGADLYVTKPFSIEAVRVKVSNLIKERRQKRINPSSDNENVKEEPEYIAPLKLSAMDEKFLNKLDTYIHDNISNEDMSVVTLSSHVNMSRVQLYRKMVALTGTTPSEYIRTYRLKYAETLLHDDSYNVSEIAYMVGFGNPRYFSKYFIAMYGMTPTKYRKKLNS